MNHLVLNKFLINREFYGMLQYFMDSFMLQFLALQIYV